MSDERRVIHREKPDMQRVYANNVNGAQTGLDFRLTFCEIVDVSQTDITVEDRVVVTLAWPAAKVLRDFLNEVFANIEGINGEIKPILLSRTVEPESVALPIQ
jgi:hypothetical protein